MNTSIGSAGIRHWLAEPLAPEVANALGRLAKTEDVVHVAVMPDVHLSQDICTGTVLASCERIFPDAVGGDIGCGMAAIRFDGPASLLENESAAARLLAGLYRVVPANRHSRLTMRDHLPDGLDEEPLSHPSLEKLKRRDGRVQFATLGRGNHFLELQADAEGFLWLMVHSGSRAMGQAIRQHHLNHAEKSSTGIKYIAADSEAGRGYLADCAWAYRYADASRRAMIDAVTVLAADLLGLTADAGSLILCNHNHVHCERRHGRDLWVHRKGAISAQEGESGIIPGSMGTASYHVEGRGNEEALCSSSHGAGRRLSRSDAFRTISVGQLHRQMKGVWFDQRLAKKLCDEAPGAYKDIAAVMRAQRDLTRIVRKLVPVLSYKGG